MYKRYLYLTELEWHGVVRINLDTDPLQVEPVAGDGGPGIADLCAHFPYCLLALVSASFRRLSSLHASPCRPRGR